MSDDRSAPLVLSDAAEVPWHFLYRSAAVAALMSIGLFLFQMVAFFVWTPPSTVAGHFALLQSRPLVGLVSLDLVIIVDEVLAIPICLALYLSLRSAHASVMLLATALNAVSVPCFLIATPALNMLYLSRQYAAAATATEREGFLAAGSAVLSSWMGTPYQVGYVLGSLAMVFIGWVMLGSRRYSKFTAWMGIVAGGVGFGAYVPKVGVYISILSVVAMQVWYALTALTLIRISRGPSRRLGENEGQTSERMLVR